jgi:hypothetical protein
MMKRHLIYLLIGLFMLVVSCNSEDSTVSDNPDGGFQNEDGIDQNGDSTDQNDDGDQSEEEDLPPSPSESAMSITQYDITWYFQDEAVSGQFVNGDWWVIGPVEIVQIDPPSTEIDGRTKNGSMLNPDPDIYNTSNTAYEKEAHGYDSHMWMPPNSHYYAELNVALGISNSNPLVLQPGSSLVSSISVDEPSSRPQLQTAAVLTVLDAIPPDGSFRPPYAGNDKSIAYNISSVESNMSLLSSLDSSVISGLPSVETTSEWFKRPWLDHMPGFLGARIHPENNMPEYGGDLANRVSEGAIWLNLDFSSEEKRDILIGFVQVGIDLYGVAVNGYINSGGYMAQWVNNGGHAAGRKFPILFAGLMLEDQDMIDIVTDPGLYFQEDQQTFYVTQENVDYGNYDPDSCGTGQTRDLPCGGYTSNMIGMPEWGIVHGTQWDMDTARWEQAYRYTNATAWFGFTLVAIIMDSVDEWGNNAIFDYIDRHHQYSEAFESDSGIRYGWIEDFWMEYRQDYTSIWPYTDWSTYNQIVYDAYNP